MKRDDCKFYVQGAGWDMLVQDTSPAGAATAAFETAYEEFGKNIKISPSIIVIDLCKVVDGDCEESVNLLETTSVLADAGLHQLSKQFKKIISRND
tara:strand:+ start:99 stop:386 length:288 start_codon:yes stop_codon:yes gene_type:complete